jgi:hypothetical protein
MPVPNSPRGAEGEDQDQNTDLSNTEGGGNPDANDDAVDTSNTADQDANDELDLAAVIAQSLAAEDTEGSEDTATSADVKDGEGTDPDAGLTDEQKAAKAAEAETAQAAADAKLPFHKHPRWQQLLAKEKSLTTELGQLKTQVGALTAKAADFDQIGLFMRDNGLDPKEVDVGFNIMALMRQDPGKALELLQPYVEKLELASGKKLPTDLEEQVTSGAITAAAAAETAKLRVENARLAQTTKVTATELNTDRVNQAVTAIRSAVETWEAGVKTRDPDFPKKQPLIADRIRSLAAQNPPKTPADAVALSTKAYDQISSELKKMLPSKNDVRPVRSDKSSTRAVAAPGTLEDVVRAALRTG